jgi:transposase
MSHTNVITRVVALAKEGMSREDIAKTLEVSTLTVNRSLSWSGKYGVNVAVAPSQAPLSRPIVVAFSPPKVTVVRQKALAALSKRSQATNDPSPEQIAERCEEIQKTWTSRERRWRRQEVEPWTPPELCCVDFCDG